jgi:hypothetical protein
MHAPRSLVIAAGFLLFALLDAVQGQPLAPQNRLLGVWRTEAGDITLRLRDDRSARLEVASLQEDARPEPRFGFYTVRRGVWVLTLYDAHDRESTFGIVSHGPAQLHLVDAKGTVIPFQRIRTPAG